MKPLPFPYALNIGTDIVHLPRITRLLTHRANYLTRFTQRILSDAEQRDFHRRFKGIAPVPASPSASASASSPATATATPQSTSTSSRTPPITPEMTRWLAGRFAAKEAARKAAPAGAASLGWKDVVVRVEEDSRTSAVDHASGVGFGSESGSGHTARDGTSRRPEIVYLHGEEARSARLSISHDGEYVVATVLAAG